MLTYWAYGLTIESEINLPELIQIPHSRPDCVIKTGKTPIKIEGPGTVNRDKIQFNRTEYLLELPNCIYYARNGKEIILNIKDSEDTKTLRHFLLTTALAAILQQRNKIMLHAGAVQTEKGLIVICGNSGAGKSTTLQYLRSHGYRIFSDDVLVLEEFSDGEIKAFASYPVLKLWDKSFDVLGMDKMSDQNKLREYVNKYRLNTQPEFCMDAQPIRMIIELEKDDTLIEPAIKQLNGYEAYVSLYLQLYRTALAETVKKDQENFIQLSRILSKTPLYKIKRPGEKNTLENIKMLIEKQKRH